MKLARQLLGTIALASAFAVHADPILVSEGFNNVGTLAGSGWSLTNNSTPGGSTNLFQGNAGVFTAQGGADDSYIAGNFNAAPGGGNIDLTLLTPFFSLESTVVLSFWARAEVIDGFSDTFRVLANTTTGGLGQVVMGPTIAAGDWTQYFITIEGQGAGAQGQFAFNYYGPSDTSNYVGFDTVNVTVPEPASLALLGLGLAGLSLTRRKKRAV